MSYLQTPRIHLAGRFYANPSTSNNFRNNYSSPPPKKLQLTFDTMGKHYFQFRDCTVTSAYSASGAVTVDQVLGAKFHSVDTSDSAKLVDLDVDNQNVSAIFGMQLALTVAGGASITGSMRTCELNGLWQNVHEPGAQLSPETASSGSFQTVVLIPKASWPETPGSPLLQSLRDACDIEEGNYLLSFKFVVDAFQTNCLAATFLTGRMVGTLGPGLADEPAQCPGARWLNYPPPSHAFGITPIELPTSQFYPGPFYVDETRKKLVIDLGNSVPLHSVEGPATHSGQIIATILSDPPNFIGPVDFSGYARITQAGIVELDLTPDQIALLSSNPLHLVSQAAGLNGLHILAEAPDGLDFAVDNRVFRMAPDTPNWQGKNWRSGVANAIVRRYGKPAGGVQLLAALIASAPNQSLPEPPDVVRFEISSSDQNGIAAVTLSAIADPNPNGRPADLDGQIYEIGIFNSRPTTPPSNTQPTNPSGERTITIHVYSECLVQAAPPWSLIQSWMSPYMRLYPAMKEFVDLSDESQFLFFRQGIQGMFSLPFDSPGYMPVTRDLSPNRIQNIINYIQNAEKPQGGAQ